MRKKLKKRTALRALDKKNFKDEQKRIYTVKTVQSI